jgi:hypothetical protein
MRKRTRLAGIGVFATLVALGGWPTTVHSQEATGPASWTAPRLADGQPDLNGMWNNVGAAHTPLELPAEFEGRVPTEEEIAALIQGRSDSRKAVQWNGFEKSGGVGAYANYWFDWYWEDPVVDAAALVVDPRNGRVPDMTEKAKASTAYYREHLHDSYDTIESGDRCLSRGVFGMMMPTAYNNGTLIVQTADHIVIHSEMIHNARVIPIDLGPHASPRITQWEGDPRGHWEGDTLVVESANFKAVGNMRAPGARAPQHEGRRMIERFTRVDADTLRYSLTVDDPKTYVSPWTVSFPWKQDNEYQQYEYACHEGNYAVPNSLSGERSQER